VQVCVGRRFAELDLLKGIAVTGMVISNYAFALRYFGVYDAGMDWLFWWLFPRVVAGTFIFIAGITAYIAYAKGKSHRTYMFRTAEIIGAGFLVTLANMAVYAKRSRGIWGAPAYWIREACSLCDAKMEGRHKRTNRTGVALIAAGFFTETYAAGSNGLLFVGLRTADYRTLDYFPIIPWFGVMVLGLAVGRIKYNREPNETRDERGTCQPCNATSLPYWEKLPVIYLLHIRR